MKRENNKKFKQIGEKSEKFREDKSIEHNQRPILLKTRSHARNLLNKDKVEGKSFKKKRPKPRKKNM